MSVPTWTREVNPGFSYYVGTHGTERVVVWKRAEIDSGPSWAKWISRDRNREQGYFETLREAKAYWRARWSR